MSDTEKVPVGTLVRYHGSLTHLHGLYQVTGYSDLNLRTDVSAEKVAEYWPDGVAYDLWPEGVPFKLGYRDQAVFFIRRDSFTVVDSNPVRTCCPTPPDTSHTGTCANSLMRSGEERFFVNE